MSTYNVKMTPQEIYYARGALEVALENLKVEHERLDDSKAQFSRAGFKLCIDNLQGAIDALIKAE